MVDGEAQVDIEEVADKFAVPFSYYHDKNGVYRAYAQPEMRGAPITVVRKEDQVYIDAYVDFDLPDAILNDPAKQQTYEAKIQQAYDSIMSTWDTSSVKRYNIDPLGTETVELNTTIHSNTPYGKQYGNGIPNGHKSLSINIDQEGLHKSLFKSTSHVNTANLEDISAYASALGLIANPVRSMSDKDNKDLLYNVGDALATKQYEKAVYNWAMENPGQMWLYNPEDAAHEFGHLLGLGDAYAVDYRMNYEADDTMQTVNDYGDAVTFSVPYESMTAGKPNNDADIMRGGYKGTNRVSNANVMLIMNQIWRNGNPYYYDKDIKKK